MFLFCCHLCPSKTTSNYVRQFSENLQYELFSTTYSRKLLHKQTLDLERKEQRVASRAQRVHVGHSMYSVDWQTFKRVEYKEQHVKCLESRGQIVKCKEQLVELRGYIIQHRVQSAKSSMLSAQRVRGRLQSIKCKEQQRVDRRALSAESSWKSLKS